MRSLLLMTLSISSLMYCYSQKTDRVKLDYEMEMLPKEMLSREKTFSFTYDFDYRESNERKKQEQENAKAAAEKNKADYEKQGAGTKLLLRAMGEKAPVVPTSTGFIPTIFSDSEISPLINIPGFTKDVNSKVSVKAIFSELVYSHDAQSGNVKATIDATLVVVNDKGRTVFSGGCPRKPEALPFYKLNSSENSSTGLSKRMRDIELFALKNCLASINEFLKVNYGYNQVKDDRSFFDVKDKKFTYNEYHEAIEKAKNAFLYIGNDSKQELFNGKLREAISLWEKSLSEIDKNNEDARINKNVAAATYLNLAEACIWLKDFEKAFNHLTDYKMLDEDYSKAYNRIQSFLEDYSARYDKYVHY